MSVSMLLIFESEIVHRMEPVQSTVLDTVVDSFRINSVVFIKNIHNLIFEDNTFFLEIDVFRQASLISKAKFTIFQVDQSWSCFGIYKDTAQ